MKKISCLFSLENSHSIVVPGFRGDNAVELTSSLKGEASFMGEVKSAEIDSVSDGEYRISICASNLDSREQQVEYFERVSEHLSFLINKTTREPRYGTCYVEMNWTSLASIPVFGEEEVRQAVYVRDTWGVTSVRKIDMSLLGLDQGRHVADVMRFYFDGLKAEYKKSKYFHWFLVLEYIERSIHYRNLFKGGSLFSEAEKQILLETTKKMSDRKRGAINSLLGWTIENRAEKLLATLNSLGIHSFRCLGENIIITENLIAIVIDGRNKALHGSTKFSEETLWDCLYPLVTEIVDRLSNNHGILDS